MRKVYLYFALTFLVGIGVGACAMFLYAWHSHHWQQRGFNQDRIVRRFKAELNLSDTQVQQLRQILTTRASTSTTSRGRWNPSFRRFAKTRAPASGRS